MYSENLSGNDYTSQKNLMSEETKKFTEKVRGLTEDMIKALFQVEKTNDIAEKLSDLYKDYTQNELFKNMPPSKILDFTQKSAYRILKETSRIQNFAGYKIIKKITITEGFTTLLDNAVQTSEKKFGDQDYMNLLGAYEQCKTDRVQSEQIFNQKIEQLQLNFNGEKEQLISEKNDLRQTVDLHVVKIKQLESKNSEFQQIITNLEASLEQTKLENAQTIETNILNTSIENKNKKIEKSSKKLFNKIMYTQSVESNILELKSSIDQIHVEKANISEQLSREQQINQELRNNLIQTQNNLKISQEQLSVSKQKVDDLIKDQLLEEQKAFKFLQDQLDKKKIFEKDYKEALMSSLLKSKQIDDCQQRVLNLEQKITELRESLKNARNISNGLLEENAALKLKLENASKGLQQ